MMKGHQRRAMWVVLCFAAAVTVLWLARPREPVVEGRKLTEWLRDFDKGTGPESLKAAEVIRAMGTNVLPRLVQDLRARDSAVRDALTSTAASLPLVRFQFDSPRARRLRALQAMRALGPLAAPALPELKTFLTEGDTPEVAVHTLRAIGADAVPVLMQAAISRNVKTREVAVSTLGSLGAAARPALPVLVQALRDPERGVRGPAVLAVSQVAETPELLLPELMACYERSQGTNYVWVRYTVAQVVSEFKAPRRQIVAALETMLEDESREVRRVAVRALLRHEPDNVAKVLPALVRNLQTPDKYGFPLRELLAELARHGSAARPALPAVEERLQHPELMVRSAAACAICRIAPERTEEMLGVLTNLLESADSGRKPTLLRDIADLGAPARTLEAQLLVLARMDDWISTEAARALAKIESPKAKETLPAVIAQLRHVNVNNRRRAVRTVATMGAGAKELLPVLKELYDDPAPDVRETARKAVREIEDAVAKKAK
ncbi:MAG: HEAT repeat domain-containing protein [Verrucomicrobiota bacterium]